MKRPSACAAAILCILLPFLCSACSRDPAQVDRGSYRKLSRLLAIPFTHQLPNSVGSSQSVLELLTRKERELTELGKTGAPNGPLASQAAGALAAISLGYSRMVNTPGPDPIASLIHLGAMFGDDPSPFGLAVAAEDDKTRERQHDVALELRSLTDRYAGIRLGLLQIAPALAGPRQTQPPLRSQFLEQGKSREITADELHLTNSSGRTLHDCLIAVRLTGANGESITNVHFLEEWQPSQTVIARYSSGEYVADVRLWRNTVANVRDVSVSMWARELSFVPR